MTLLPLLSRNRLVKFCVVYVVLMTLVMCATFRLDDTHGLRVFGSYWASGQASLHGLNPYDVHPLTWVTPFGIVDLNLNPPTLLPFLELVARFDPVTSAKVWTISSAALFIGAVLLLIADGQYGSQRRQVLWLFFAPAFLDVLFLGQIYCFLFVLIVWAWLMLERGQAMVAGVLIGVFVAMKPNFGVWLLFLLLAGHWRVAVIGVLAGMAAVALSIASNGVEPYSQWLAALAADTHAEKVFTEVSIYGYLTRLGYPKMGSVLAVFILVSSAYWVWRRRFCSLDASKLALVVSILASPLAWVHYTLFLIPALIRNRWSSVLTVAAILLLVPIEVPIEMMRGPQWLTPIGGGIYFSAVCLIYAAFILELHRRGNCNEAQARAVQ